MSKLHGSSTKWDHITYNYGWWDSRLHTLTNHSLMVIWKPCGPSCLCSVCDTEIPCSNTAGLSIWSDAQVHAERNVWLSFSMRDLHSDTVWLCQILFDCVRLTDTVWLCQILFDCVECFGVEACHLPRTACFGYCFATVTDWCYGCQVILGNTASIQHFHNFSYQYLDLCNEIHDMIVNNISWASLLYKFVIIIVVILAIIL